MARSHPAEDTGEKGSERHEGARTNRDAWSLLGKVAAFVEGLEPGERAVLFDSLPKSPAEEAAQDEVQGHYYSGSDVLGGRPGAPSGELGLEGE